MNYYLYLIGGWAVYLFAHSYLAADSVKKKIPWPPREYRLFYVLISSVGFLGLLYFIALSPQDYLYPPSQLTKYVGLVLAVWGVIVVKAAFRHLSLKSFLGLKKEEDSALLTSGIHGKVRHPIYSGTILIMLGMLIAVPNVAVLISCLCVFIYLPIGIYLEEKKLIAEFGDDYREYKQQVKAIIPGFL